MKGLLPLLFLILAIFISGCAGIGSLQGGQKKELACIGSGVTEGISITDFSFDFDQIYANESVGLTLTVENLGGSKGCLTGIELFGMYINSSDNMAWKNTSGLTSMKLEDCLEAPNPDLNIPGGMDTILWTLQAPSSLTVETPCTLNGRVTYNYTTSFSGVLTVMSQKYLASIPTDQRKTLIQSGGLSASCYTGGPIKVEAAAGTHFVDPAGKKIIKFKVTNVGMGFPFYNKTHQYYDGICPTSIYKINVKKSSGMVSCNEQNITLSRGQTGTFSCDFTAPTFNNKIDLPFQIDIEYQYWVDNSISIKVLRPL